MKAVYLPLVTCCIHLFRAFKACRSVEIFKCPSRLCDICGLPHIYDDVVTMCYFFMPLYMPLSVSKAIYECWPFF